MVLPVLPLREQSPQDPMKIARHEHAYVATYLYLLTSEGLRPGVAMDSNVRSVAR
jgi:hypothetical protein